ncbi:MAG: NAD(P)-binding domain-containing protein, partial [Oscillospiraceae bacterium]|nr:NAD(P)-binding domain-containing protein [Oscillospiraceae bacterium]
MATTLGFIGAGNMGSAVMKGFSASEAAKDVEILVYDINPQMRDMLKSSGFSVVDDEMAIVRLCKFVVLACKPQQLAHILEKIKPRVTDNTVFISLCAGISAEYIRQHTIPGAKVVLVMPNMPVLMGVGASALAFDEAVSSEESAFVRQLIESCGTVEVIPLNKMNEIICINASSPAFIYLFAKCFADYAEEQGINSKAALNLFSQTLIGASKMMTESGHGINELIEQVS